MAGHRRGPELVVAPDSISKAVHSFVMEVGLVPAATSLGMSKTTIACVAARFPVEEATVSHMEVKLRKLGRTVEVAEQAA